MDKAIIVIRTVLLFQLIQGGGRVTPRLAVYKGCIANLAPAGKMRGKVTVKLGSAFRIYTRYICKLPLMHMVNSGNLLSPACWPFALAAGFT